MRGSLWGDLDSVSTQQVVDLMWDLNRSLAGLILYQFDTVQGRA